MDVEVFVGAGAAAAAFFVVAGAAVVGAIVSFCTVVTVGPATSVSTCLDRLATTMMMSAENAAIITLAIASLALRSLTSRRSAGLRVARTGSSMALVGATGPASGWRNSAAIAPTAWMPAGSSGWRARSASADSAAGTLGRSSLAGTSRPSRVGAGTNSLTPPAPKLTVRSPPACGAGPAAGGQAPVSIR